MKLSDPFFISARLAPAVKVGDVTLSFSDGEFVFDFPDGREYVVTDFHFPRARIAGATDESVLQDGFAAVLSFLGACAESIAYRRRTGRGGENADLFPDWIGEWADLNSDEIAMAELVIQETKGAIAP